MEHVRVVPVRAYFTDTDRGIELGRRVVGYRAESEGWHGRTRRTRQEAVEDMAGRKSILLAKQYTEPDAA